MNEAYLASLRGRAQRYDGRERKPTNTVGAVADLQQKERATVVTLQELEDQLVLENRRRLVAEKALLESEQERMTLERLLKDATPARPIVVPDDDV